MKIPKLKKPVVRFPEFGDNWHDACLGDYLEFRNGFNAEKSQYGTGTKFINVLDIINDSPITYDSIIGKVRMSNAEVKNYEVRFGDILFQRSSETREEVGQSNVYLDKNHNATFGGFVIRGTAKQSYDPLFLHYLLKTASARKDITSRSGGSTRYNIGQESLKEVRVLLPTEPEQKKMAAFLSAVDERISQIISKRALLLQYKKGVMQQLFEQKIRFRADDGNDFPDWKEQSLSALLREHKIRNSDTQVVEVFSVAKNSGVINQLEHLGRSYAAEDTSNYNVVLPGDIVYTKSPTSEFPYGIIKQNKTGRTGIVSVLYAVFTPKTTQLGCLLDYYFSSCVKTYNYLNPIVQKGAKNTINIGNDDFLTGKKISLPTSSCEIDKVVRFLSALDEKIVLFERELEKSKVFRNGLLQQMFV